jgi:hypothetical protein
MKGLLGSASVRRKVVCASAATLLPTPSGCTETTRSIAFTSLRVYMTTVDGKRTRNKSRADGVSQQWLTRAQNDNTGFMFKTSGRKDIIGRTGRVYFVGQNPLPTSNGTNKLSNRITGLHAVFLKVRSHCGSEHTIVELLEISRGSIHPVNFGVPQERRPSKY